jgi:hypothetical protein
MRNNITWTRNFLAKKTIGIVGYDDLFSKYYALNIKENNFNVIVGTQRYSSEWNYATYEGWKSDYDLFSIDEMMHKSDIIFSPKTQIEEKYIIPIMNNDKMICYSNKTKNINKIFNIVEIKTNDTHFMTRFNFITKYDTIESQINILNVVNHNSITNAIALTFAYGSDIVYIDNNLYKSFHLFNIR